MLLFNWNEPAKKDCPFEDSEWVMAESNSPNVSPRKAGWDFVSEQTCSFSYKDATLISTKSTVFTAPTVNRACDSVIRSSTTTVSRSKPHNDLEALSTVDASNNENWQTKPTKKNKSRR